MPRPMTVLRIFIFVNVRPVRGVGQHFVLFIYFAIVISICMAHLSNKTSRIARYVYSTIVRMERC